LLTRIWVPLVCTAMKHTTTDLMSLCLSLVRTRRVGASCSWKRHLYPPSNQTANPLNPLRPWYRARLRTVSNSACSDDAALLINLGAISQTGVECPHEASRCGRGNGRADGWLALLRSVRAARWWSARRGRLLRFSWRLFGPGRRFLQSQCSGLWQRLLCGASQRFFPASASHVASHVCPDNRIRIKIWTGAICSAPVAVSG
jgi:hypothetical protein